MKVHASPVFLLIFALSAGPLLFADELLIDPSDAATHVVQSGTVFGVVVVFMSKRGTPSSISGISSPIRRSPAGFRQADPCSFALSFYCLSAIRLKCHSEIPPVHWTDYQRETAKFFQSLGYDTSIEETLEGARGKHKVDVVIRFERPPSSNVYGWLNVSSGNPTFQKRRSW
jgi:hypothetical protein